jgi:hypothetical protein
VLRWPDAGPSEYRLLASSPASEVKKNKNKNKKTSKAHTHTQYNKYTLDDNNTHKTTTIHMANQQQLHTRKPKTGKITHETI